MTKTTSVPLAGQGAPTGALRGGKRAALASVPAAADSDERTRDRVLSAVLEHDPDAGTQFRAGCAGVSAEQRDGSARSLLQPLCAFDGGSLAGTVGSEQRRDFTAAGDE